ncbi:MAG: Wzz/FepE/Etk N-terminal domain-containing protein [Planctomycetota bacterium]
MAQHALADPAASRIVLPQLDFHLIWRRKLTFLVCAAFTTALGVAYLAVEKPTYEVSRRVLVEPERPAQDDGSPTMTTRQFAPTQAELLRSPKVIRRALEAAPLEVPTAWREDVVGFISESLTVTQVVDTAVLKIRFRANDPVAAGRFVDALVKSYRDILREQQSETVERLKVMLTDEEHRRREELESMQARHLALLRKSPYPAKLEENASVKADNLVQLSRQLAETRQRRASLAARLKQVREMTATQVARGANPPTPSSASKSPPITRMPRPTPPLTEANYRPQELEERPVMARGTRTAPVSTAETTALCESAEESRELSEFARAAKEMALAESPLGIGLSSEQSALFQLLRDGDGGSDGVLLELQRQLTQAQLRRQQLAVQFGPKHDAFRQVEAEIVRLEQMLRNQLSSLMDSLEQRLVAEDAAVDELRQRYDSETREMKELDNFVAQDAVLRAEIKRTEDAYGLVFAQLKQVSLVDEALTKGRSDVSVVDLEPSNEKPPKVWPLTGPLLMLSFAVGIFGALLLIYSSAVFQAGAAGRSTEAAGAVAG